jgi:hypothetical protein
VILPESKPSHQVKVVGKSAPSGQRFDGPSKKKQPSPANRAATEEPFRRDEAFFAAHLR